jgi:DNA-binding NarL/FixJ family response regulator
MHNHTETQGVIRVVHIDDHLIVTDALTALLEDAGDISVVAQVNHPSSIVDEIAKHKPDIAICDLEMPGGDPLDRLAQGMSLSPKTRVMVLTAYPTDFHINRAIQIGVHGFLTKNEPLEALVDGVRAIAAGHTIYSTEVRERMSDSRGSSISEPKLLALTPRELSVVRLVALGMTTAQIADSIHRSPKTIDNQISSALAKTNSANRVELSRWAIREGLVRA